MTRRKAEPWMLPVKKVWQRVDRWMSKVSAQKLLARGNCTRRRWFARCLLARRCAASTREQSICSTPYVVSCVSTCSLTESGRGCSSASGRRPPASPRLPELAPPHLASGVLRGRDQESAAVRPTPRLRLASDPSRHVDPGTRHLAAAAPVSAAAQRTRMSGPSVGGPRLDRRAPVLGLSLRA